MRDDHSDATQSAEDLLDPGCRLAQDDREALRRAEAISPKDLLETLRNNRNPAELRAAAAWALGQTGEISSGPALTTALSDGSPRVREAAARAAAELSYEPAVRPLIETLLADTQPAVRKAAAYALGLLGDHRAEGALVRVLENTREEPNVRGIAAEALADLRARGAAPSLIAALRDASSEVRYWAAFALGELGSAQALPELERLVAEDRADVPGFGSVGNEAREAIERITGRASSCSAERQSSNASSSN